MTDFAVFRDRFAEACRARGVAKGRIVTNPIGRKRKRRVSKNAQAAMLAF